MCWMQLVWWGCTCYSHVKKKKICHGCDKYKMSSITPFLQLGQSHNVKRLQTYSQRPSLPEGSQSMCNPFSMFWLLGSFPRWKSLDCIHAEPRCVEVFLNRFPICQSAFFKKNIFQHNKTNTCKSCGSTIDHFAFRLSSVPSHTYWHLPVNLSLPFTSKVSKSLRCHDQVTKLLRYSFSCSYTEGINVTEKQALALPTS